jgi:hypothetical protein
MTEVTNRTNQRLHLVTWEKITPFFETKFVDRGAEPVLLETEI